jgi:hypothetical protein
LDDTSVVEEGEVYNDWEDGDELLKDIDDWK